MLEDTSLEIFIAKQPFSDSYNYRGVTSIKAEEAVASALFSHHEYLNIVPEDQAKRVGRLGNRDIHNDGY